MFIETVIDAISSIDIHEIKIILTWAIVRRVDLLPYVFPLSSLPSFLLRELPNCWHIVPFLKEGYPKYCHFRCPYKMHDIYNI